MINKIPKTVNELSQNEQNTVQMKGTIFKDKKFNEKYLQSPVKVLIVYEERRFGNLILS